MVQRRVAHLAVVTAALASVAACGSAGDAETRACRTWEIQVAQEKPSTTFVAVTAAVQADLDAMTAGDALGDNFTLDDVVTASLADLRTAAAKAAAVPGLDDDTYDLFVGVLRDLRDLRAATLSSDYEPRTVVDAAGVARKAADKITARCS